MADANQVPVRESVGAALRFVRENMRLVLIASALAAAGATVLTALSMAIPSMGLITPLFSGFIQSAFFAVLILAALGQPRTQVLEHAMRVWAAMVVIGFFLFIVMFVISIPVMIALVAGPLGPYADELQAANGVEAEVMAVMVRFAQEQPMAVLVTFLVYASVWMVLTSRLFLAAPASVDQRRILSFETWAWTKGGTLRIIAARLMVLAPAYLLTTALSYLIGRPVGIDPFSPPTAMAAMEANPAGFLAYVAVVGFVSMALYSAFEAGLATYLYRGLKPESAAPRD